MWSAAGACPCIASRHSCSMIWQHLTTQDSLSRGDLYTFSRRIASSKVILHLHYCTFANITCHLARLPLNNALFSAYAPRTRTTRTESIAAFCHFVELELFQFFFGQNWLRYLRTCADGHGHSAMSMSGILSAPELWVPICFCSLSIVSCSILNIYTEYRYDPIGYSSFDTKIKSGKIKIKNLQKWKTRATKETISIKSNDRWYKSRDLMTDRRIMSRKKTADPNSH